MWCKHDKCSFGFMKKKEKTHQKKKQKKKKKLKPTNQEQKNTKTKEATSPQRKKKTQTTREKEDKEKKKCLDGLRLEGVFRDWGGWELWKRGRLGGGGLRGCYSFWFGTSGGGGVKKHKDKVGWDRQLIPISGGALFVVE